MRDLFGEELRDASARRPSWVLDKRDGLDHGVKLIGDFEEAPPINDTSTGSTPTGTISPTGNTGAGKKPRGGAG